MSNRINATTTKEKLAIICCLWVIIFGFRGYAIGNDTIDYISFFLSHDVSKYGSLNGDSDLEPGFILITKVIYFISTSYTIWFTIIAAWLWYSIYRFYTLVVDYKKMAANLLVVLIIINTFVTLMVAMRQATAICVFLTGLNLLLKESLVYTKWEILLKKKKAIIGCLLILSTIFIHKSMIVLLPIILLASIINLGKKTLIGCVLTSCILSYFYSDNIGVIFNTFFLQFGDLGVSFINSDVMNIYSEDFGGNTQKTTTYIAWALPAILNIYLSDTKEVKDIFFNLYIISVCFFMLFSTTFLIERINTVLILLGFTRFLPTAATYNTKWRAVYIVLIFAMLIVAFNRYNNWPITDSCIPYKFFWE